MIYMVMIKRKYNEAYTSLFLVKMKGTRLMHKSELRRMAAEYYNVIENNVCIL
jgi:hypothetical protein